MRLLTGHPNLRLSPQAYAILDPVILVVALGLLAWLGWRFVRWLLTPRNSN
jgi:hypothetical protein